MKYNPPTGSIDPNAPFLGKNPAIGQQGSKVPPKAVEHTQREIVEVITSAGLTPSENSTTQLNEAIGLKIAAGGTPDNATFMVVQSDPINDPPTVPAGNRWAYPISTAPTGAWVGHAGKIAVSTGSGAWVIQDALAGRVVRVGETDTYFRRAGAGGWVAHSFVSASHSHPISDVTGLQSALDGKVAKAGDSMSGNLLFSNNVGARFSSVSGTFTAGSAGGEAFFSTGNNFHIRNYHAGKEIILEVAGDEIAAFGQNATYFRRSPLMVETGTGTSHRFTLIDRGNVEMQANPATSFAPYWDFKFLDYEDYRSRIQREPDRLSFYQRNAGGAEINPLALGESGQIYVNNGDAGNSSKVLAGGTPAQWLSLGYMIAGGVAFARVISSIAEGVTPSPRIAAACSLGVPSNSGTTISVVVTFATAQPDTAYRVRGFGAYTLTGGTTANMNICDDQLMSMPADGQNNHAISITSKTVNGFTLNFKRFDTSETCFIDVRAER